MTSPVSPATALLPNRRTVIQSGLAACALAAWPSSLLARWNIAEGRPVPADRHFSSPAIEEVIDRIRGQVADPILGAMFTRCFPNTLDTTVFPGTRNGQPDTFVITGDIDAMWVRDSSAQVWPYLPFAKRDKSLAAVLAGIVRR
ncbi:MAG: glycoside hydrolase family 125 protein, partial [Acidobacteriaceae bacterium]